MKIVKLLSGLHDYQYTILPHQTIRPLGKVLCDDGTERYITFSGMRNAFRIMTKNNTVIQNPQSAAKFKNAYKYHEITYIGLRKRYMKLEGCTFLDVGNGKTKWASVKEK